MAAIVKEQRKAASRHPDHFRLQGPSIPLDPRNHAFRPDLADVALAGQVIAPYYAQPRLCACALPSAIMRNGPDAAAIGVSQILLGESFAVLDIADGWAWGYSEHDHYVGYVEASALEVAAGNPTHIVSAPSALLFSTPDIKSAHCGTLPMGARVSARSRSAKTFVETDHGWIHARHLRPIGDPDSDAVTVAERLLGSPYLWGGRGGDGVDCSGLVQLALGLCGVSVPRDSDQQRETIGTAVKAKDIRRGDLVFFPAHVGLMADGKTLVHANAWWMAVTREPLTDVIDRLKLQYDKPVLAVKRL